MRPPPGACADRTLLSESDLVSEEDLLRVEKRLKSMNCTAQIVRCQKAAVSVDSVLDIRAFDLDRTLEMDPEFLNTDAEHEHDSSVSSLSITQDGDLNMDLLDAGEPEIVDTVARAMAAEEA